jgi:hypothetical protein
LPKITRAPARELRHNGDGPAIRPVERPEDPALEPSGSGFFAMPLGRFSPSVDQVAAPRHAPMAIAQTLRLAGLSAAAAILLCLPARDSHPPLTRPHLVLWAWERPEDLSYAGPGDEVAAVVGFVDLAGARMTTRGRRAPLKLAPGVEPIAVIHLQIDPRQPVAWTPELRARTAATVLTYARRSQAKRVQIDFEVRESQRPVLLDLLRDVRAGLGAETSLSMTALASWCDTERWLDQAPVDEIVPMLFRMGPGGKPLSARLARGGDFGDPRCRSAYGVALDQMPKGAPKGRRIYVFNPRSWTRGDLAAVRRNVLSWPS